MDRRTFLSTLGVAVLAPSLAAEAQPGGKVWRIGFCGPGYLPPAGPRMAQALRPLLLTDLSPKG